MIETIIKSSLSDFYSDVKVNKWIGREREAVSHFVTAHLINQVKKNTIFHSLSQAVIEGAVQQWDKTPKKQVNKDLLIWPTPGMTTWNSKWESKHAPIAILEWKVHRKRKKFTSFHGHDVEWLEWFTKENKGTFGFVVALDILTDNVALNAGFVQNGKTNTEWLSIS
ncbi:MAG: hypothetical protein KUG82_09595 [Pseudomonadales bacterium]|nr:hypothetical protein [Pseudomonadales bacterium]